MSYINQSEQEKISQELREFVKSRLLDNYKNQKGQVVDSIESIGILKISIDDEKSDRDRLIVSVFYVDARVWVKLSEGTANNNLRLRNNIAVELVYNPTLKKYVINNAEKLTLLDFSQQ